ncbi:MAG TPA: glycosyltransferase family 4 protein [Candidatus Acidoferrales bacterium]|nr:glycosyltransferase family 4 protein [Candidatus Acidoferrales bacterium]
MSHLTGSSYSITVHTVATHFPTMLIREVLRGAAFVVADTHQVEEFLQTLGVRRGRIRLIRNGVPIDELSFRYGQDVLNPPVILAAGYFSRKKGFDVLLTACGLLLQRGIRFRCVLVGDGEERNNLMSLRRKLHLENEVEMPGDLSFDKLRTWYYRAALFVMPSIVPPNGSTDGLPTVVIEALACGTPVIGTDTAGIPEVLVDGRTGILVRAGAPEAIADGIQMLLSHETQRESLAREGRRLIEQEFDLRKNSKIIANLIALHATVPFTITPTT